MLDYYKVEVSAEEYQPNTYYILTEYGYELSSAPYSSLVTYYLAKEVDKYLNELDSLKERMSQIENTSGIYWLNTSEL